MAIDVTAYAKELMDAGEIKDAEQRKALEAFFSNDKVRAKFEPTLREATEGVERERGRTAAEAAKAKDAETKMNQYYQDGLKTYETNKQLVADAQAEVARYEATYGKLEAGERKQAVQDVIDKKTFDARVAQVEGNTVGLAKSIMKITARHLREFPDLELDPDAIAKVAQEKNLTAEKAWEEWTQPQRQAKEAARVTAERATAVETALIEDRSKRGASAVVDSAPRSEFITNLAKNNPTPSALESFTKGWQDPNAKATMDKEFGPR